MNTLPSSRGPARRLLRPLLAVTTVAALLVSPSAVQAGSIIPEWLPSVHSNPNPGTPSGSGTATGDSLMLTIVGGGTGHSNYVRLFSKPMEELSYPKPGEAVKLSVSGISFVPVPGDAPGADQVLYFTLSPTPDGVPYKDGATGIQQGISLSVTASGAYSLGWVTGAAGEKGWLPMINSSGRSGVATDPITGFELTLTDTTYQLVLITTGDPIELLGQHGITGPWGDLGINVTLKKMFPAGSGGNTLTAHIDSLELSVIPEPKGVALVGAGMALLLVTQRRVARKRASLR